MEFRGEVGALGENENMLQTTVASFQLFLDGLPAMATAFQHQALAALSSITCGSVGRDLFKLRGQLCGQTLDAMAVLVLASILGTVSATLIAADIWRRKPSESHPSRSPIDADADEDLLDPVYHLHPDVQLE